MTARASAFSLRRIALLLRLQWQEQRRAWALFALVLAVLLVLVAAVALSTGDGRGVKTQAQAFVYIAGLMFSGYLFAHQVFGVWRSREASLMYLMRPASAFEKWAVSALTLLVVYPLLYTAVFALVYSVAGEVGYRMAMANAQEMLRHQPTLTQLYQVKASEFATFIPLRSNGGVPESMGLRAQAAVAIIYAALTGYAALGLVYFRRHAAARTLVAAIGACILTGFVLSLMSDAVNPRALGAWLAPADETQDMTWTAWAYSCAYWLAPPLLLWAASYRALVERDLS